MKKIFGLCLLVVCMFILLTSCGKGTPGCTDSTASNYYSSATKDDGSCKYVGNAMFWTNHLSLHGETLIVTLDNGQTTTITVNYSSAPPCGTSVGGNIQGISTGSHSFTTKDYFGAKTTGTITISTNICTPQYLN